MSTTDQRGFNILELLLAIAIVVAIAGIIIPISGNAFTRNNLNLSTQQIVQNFRRAQSLAQASTGNSDWGVYLSGYTTTIFKGASYAARDTNYDELAELYGRATSSGLIEVVFNKATGLPKAFGTTTIMITNEISNISINAKGIINY